MRRSRRAARARGFTLIEVLAALVIVGLGMLGVIQAVIQAVNNGTYMREKTLAHWIAMNLITERRVQRSPPDVGETSDEIDYAGQRWRWTVKVSGTAVESMRRLDVSVGFADAPDDATLARAVGFYGTAIAPAGSTRVTWEGTVGRDGRPPPGGQSGGGDTDPKTPAPGGGDETDPAQDPAPEPPAGGDE